MESQTTNLQKETGEYKTIKQYDSNYFLLSSGESYREPIALFNDKVFTQILPKCFEKIDESHIDQWIELNPDIIIIGCGTTHVFLPPAWQALFYQKKIGIDTMTTASACRTFSILAIDKRNALGLFFPITDN